MVWNVWKNHEDVLIGSAICKYLSRGSEDFEEIKTMSQGGYHIYPNEIERLHLDEFIEVPNVNTGLTKISPKYQGVQRIISGISNAYQFGFKNNLDYVFITNADAWVLSLTGFRNVLSDKKISESAISLRVGKVGSIFNSFGEYIPYIDDHFIVINISKCKSLGLKEIFNVNDLNPIFSEFGGIHYVLLIYLEKMFNVNDIYIYTDMTDSRNHFNETGSYSVLPLQYQRKYYFLHANCEQEEKLHYLRAQYLKLNNLMGCAEAKNYYVRYSNSPQDILEENGIPYFKKNILKKTQISTIIILRFLYMKLLSAINYKFIKYSMNVYNKGQIYYKDYAILPIYLSSRKP